MHAYDEFWLAVPLVVRDVITCLQPDPLLSLGQETIVARYPLADLDHCHHGK